MAAAATTPCKITSVGLGRFQAKAADMPLNCLLSTPDNKTEILNVTVFKSSDNSKVAGQPVSQTDMTFSLNLPAGDYSVVIIVGFLTGAKAVEILESCTGQTDIVFIAVPVANNGQFALQVVP
jgi:hypothetical protein